MRRGRDNFPYFRGLASKQVKIGDIWCSTLSRRNERCRAYQIVEIDSESVLVREIGWHIYMSKGRRYAVPIPGKHIGSAERLTVEEGQYCNQIEWVEQNQRATPYYKGSAYPADMVRRVWIEAPEYGTN